MKIINLIKNSIKIITESGRVIEIPPSDKKFELNENVVHIQFIDNGVPIFFKEIKVILPEQEEDEIFIIPKNIVQYLTNEQRMLNLVYPENYVVDYDNNIIGFRGLTAVSWTTDENIDDNSILLNQTLTVTTA